MLNGPRASIRIAFDLLRSIVFPIPHRQALAAATPTVSDVVHRMGAHTELFTGELTLLSWNVHRGYDPQRLQASLLRLLAEHDPDVVLLQEVPVYPERPFWEEPALAAPLAGFHLFFAPMHEVLRRTSYYPFRFSGQLTLSRFPFAAAEAHGLPQVSRPKLGRHHRVRRVVAVTRLQAAAGAVGIYNLHLENTTGPGGRRLQMRCVLDLVEEHGDRVAVLGGDFNPLFDPCEPLHGEIARGGFRRLFERRCGLWPRLDFFFARGASAARGRALSAAGSDHQPILARIEV